MKNKYRNIIWTFGILLVFCIVGVMATMVISDERIDTSGTLNASQLDVSGSDINMLGESGTGIKFYNNAEDAFYIIRSGGTGSNSLLIRNLTEGTILTYLTEFEFQDDIDMNEHQIKNVDEITMTDTDTGARTSITWENESSTPYARITAHTDDDPANQFHWQVYTSNASDGMISRFDIDAHTDTPRAEFHDTGLVISLSNSNAPALRINVSSSGTAPLVINTNLSAIPCNSGNEGGIYYDTTVKKHLGCNSTTWVALY